MVVGNGAGRGSPFAARRAARAHARRRRPWLLPEAAPSSRPVAPAGSPSKEVSGHV